MIINRNQPRHPAGARDKHGKPIGGKWKRTRPDELPVSDYRIRSWNMTQKHTTPENLQPADNARAEATSAANKAWSRFIASDAWVFWLANSAEHRQVWHQFLGTCYDPERLERFKQVYHAEQQFGLSSSEMETILRQQYVDLFGAEVMPTDLLPNAAVSKVGIPIMPLSVKGKTSEEAINDYLDAIRKGDAGVRSPAYRQMKQWITDNETGIMAAWVISDENMAAEPDTIRLAVQGWAWAVAEETTEHHQQSINDLVYQLKNTPKRLLDQIVNDSAFVDLSDAYQAAKQIEADLMPEIQSLVDVLSKHRLSTVETHQECPV